MSVDAVVAWAMLLGMDVRALYRGSSRYIELTGSPHHEAGETHGTLGQSAFVLVKPV